MKLVTTSLAILVAVSVAHATTIHVPSDQPTIQAGINAAVNGDTVLVAPGTYTENLLVNVRGLALISSGGCDITTVEPVDPDAPIIRCDYPSDSTFLLRGLSFRNSGNSDGLNCRGGRVQDCIISHCRNRGINSSGPLSVSNCQVSYCDLAIFCSQSISVDNSQLSNCGSHGIFAAAPVTLSVHDCMVTVGGVGVYMPGPGGTYTVRNCLVSAAYKGIQVVGTGSIINNTVVNAGSGPAIAIEGNQGGTVLNNIVAYNQAPGIVVSPSSVVDYNDVWHNGEPFSDPGPHGISVNPQFTDTTTHDYTLKESSPCIDAGHPDPQYNDLDGTRNDMGALPHLQTTYPYVTIFEFLGESQYNIISSSPTFAWHYYSPSGTAISAFEIAVGTNSDWTYAEMWNPAQISEPTAQVQYAGAPFQDGHLYYLRLRVEDSAGWSLWYYTTFRTNSVPAMPTPMSPNVTIVSSHPLLTLQNASDPEGDALKYDFEVYADSSLTSLVTSQLNVSQISGQTSWAVAQTLTDNLRYWWRARAFDGFEHGDWSSPLTFWVDGVPEAPSVATLVSPPDSAGLPVFDLLPTFLWNVPVDSDPFDTAIYKMQLSFNPSFALSFSYDSLHQSQYTLTDSLPFGTHLWWRVTSRDKYGLTSVSTAKNFWTWELGDVDHSHGTDIADLSRLIDYLYISFSPITPLKVGDLDGDCRIDIADLSRLIDRLYISFAPLGVGCE